MIKNPRGSLALIIVLVVLFAALLGAYYFKFLSLSQPGLSGQKKAAREAESTQSLSPTPPAVIDDTSPSIIIQELDSLNITDDETDLKELDADLINL